MASKIKPLINRFMEKTEMIPLVGCWIWSGACDDKGYGILATTFKKSPKKAHRVAYELFIGEIPDGLLIRHQCDTPSCVNPSHLEIGTSKDNSQDMAKRCRMNKKSFENLRPGKLGFLGAGPVPNKEIMNGISK